MRDILYIVMPVFNEEEVIQDSIVVVSNKIKSLIKSKKISKDSKLVIVDDGSTDNTLAIVKEIQKKIW